MSATQPGSPPDTDDDAESRGLGPIVKPAPTAQDSEEWVPSKDHPGFLQNRDTPPKLKYVPASDTP